jgi:hypothetical protein
MEWLRLRMRRFWVYRVINLLRESETHEHDEARRDPKASVAHRDQAEEDADIRRELTAQYYSRGALVHDESVNNNAAPVQVTKVSTPKTSRDLIQGSVLALSVMVNVVLGAMYLSSQRTVTDAYKDIKTQVWLRQDKDDERFAKFLAGPYAELSGKVEASQILFGKCEENRK